MIASRDNQNADQILTKTKDDIVLIVQAVINKYTALFVDKKDFFFGAGKEGIKRRNKLQNIITNSTQQDERTLFIALCDFYFTEESSSRLVVVLGGVLQKMVKKTELLERDRRMINAGLLEIKQAEKNRLFQLVLELKDDKMYRDGEVELLDMRSCQ
jgi:hypothetical protein